LKTKANNVVTVYKENIRLLLLANKTKQLEI